MALLSLGYRLFAGEFVLQDGGGFCVAERGEGTAVGAVAGDQAFGFFDEASVEHGGGALIDALVEARAGRVEPEAQNAVAGEGVAPLLPLLSEWTVSVEGDFDGSNDFCDIVGMNGRRGCSVKAGEKA